MTHIYNNIHYNILYINSVVVLRTVLHYFIIVVEISQFCLEMYLCSNFYFFIDLYQYSYYCTWSAFGIDFIFLIVDCWCFFAWNCFTLLLHCWYMSSYEGLLYIHNKLNCTCNVTRNLKNKIVFLRVHVYVNVHIEHV